MRRPEPAGGEASLRYRCELTPEIGPLEETLTVVSESRARFWINGRCFCGVSFPGLLLSHLIIRLRPRGGSREARLPAAGAIFRAAGRGPGLLAARWATPRAPVSSGNGFNAHMWIKSKGSYPPPPPLPPIPSLSPSLCPLWCPPQRGPLRLTT